MEVLEVGGEERRLSDVERDRVLGARVDPERLRHPRVGLLVRLHSVGWVHVERQAQPTLMQPVRELVGIREQAGVPGVPGPTTAEAALDVHVVPVHVDHGDRERDFLRGEPLEKCLVLVLAIGVKPAPPVTEGEPGEQRGRPGEAIEVAETFAVAASIAEEIQVLRAGAPRREPAVVGAEQGLAVVDDCKTVAGQDAGLQRDRPIRVIEGAGRTAQGFAGDRVAPETAVRAEVAPHRDGESVRRERLLVIAEVNVLGDDLQTA